MGKLLMAHVIYGQLINALSVGSNPLSPAIRCLDGQTGRVRFGPLPHRTTLDNTLHNTL